VTLRNIPLKKITEVIIIQAYSNITHILKRIQNFLTLLILSLNLHSISPLYECAWSVISCTERSRSMDYIHRGAGGSGRRFSARPVRRRHSNILFSSRNGDMYQNTRRTGGEKKMEFQKNRKKNSHMQRARIQLFHHQKKHARLPGCGSSQRFTKQTVCQECTMEVLCKTNWNAMLHRRWG